MTISQQFGDVDAHGATVRPRAAPLEAEHQAIVREVLAAGDFWGGNAHGQKVQTAGSNMAPPTQPSALAGPNCNLATMAVNITSQWTRYTLANLNALRRHYAIADIQNSSCAIGC